MEGTSSSGGLEIGISCFTGPHLGTGGQKHTHTLNKTNTLNGYDFTINVFEDEFNSLQKESLMLFEAYCVFGYREFHKNLLCILMKVNKTMYGNNECVPDKLLGIFLLSSLEIRNHMNWWVVAPDPVFPQSYQTIINSLTPMVAYMRPFF
jgi:hypothetical protein